MLSAYRERQSAAAKGGVAASPLVTSSSNFPSSSSREPEDDEFDSFLGGFGDFEDKLNALADCALSLDKKDSRQRLQQNGFSFQRAKMVKMLSSKSLKSSFTTETEETAETSDSESDVDNNDEHYDVADDSDDDDDESVAELLKDANHPFNFDNLGFTDDDFDCDETVFEELEQLDYEEISQRFFQMQEEIRKSRERKEKKAKKAERKARKERRARRRRNTCARTIRHQ